MIRYLCYAVGLILFLGPLWATADETPAQPSAEISREDLEVISVMETLDLMEVVAQQDLLNDMEILIEQEGKENDEN